METFSQHFSVSDLWSSQKGFPPPLQAGSHSWLMASSLPSPSLTSCSILWCSCCCLGFNMALNIINHTLLFGSTLTPSDPQQLEVLHTSREDNSRHSLWEFFWTLLSLWWALWKMLTIIYSMSASFPACLAIFFFSCQLQHWSMVSGFMFWSDCVFINQWIFFLLVMKGSSQSLKRHRNQL